MDTFHTLKHFHTIILLHFTKRRCNEKPRQESGASDNQTLQFLQERAVKTAKQKGARRGKNPQAQARGTGRHAISYIKQHRIESICSLQKNENLLIILRQTLYLYATHHRITV
jgi:hypothetical protein